jgi:putative Mg2+ transporter-C (MgtC) family protein
MGTLWWGEALAQLFIVAQVAAAMVLGGLIGIDRELQDKPAGLRTHMLMAGTAALLVVLGRLTVVELSSSLGVVLVESDPVRIIGAVVTGVSFLGAGTILRRDRQRQVEGLTTAASLLATAAVGMCVALSQWLLALGVTVLVLITLAGISRVERMMDRRSDQS